MKTLLVKNILTFLIILTFSSFNFAEEEINFAKKNYLTNRHTYLFNNSNAYTWNYSNWERFRFLEFETPSCHNYQPAYFWYDYFKKKWPHWNNWSKISRDIFSWELGGIYRLDIIFSNGYVDTVKVLGVNDGVKALILVRRDENNNIFEISEQYNTKFITRYEFYYDDQGKLTDNTTYIRVDCQLLPRKQENYFHNNKNLLERIILYDWDGDSVNQRDWVEKNRILLSYDSTNKVIEKYDSLCSRTIFVYNENQHIKEYFEYEIKSDSEEVLLHYKGYEYDTSNQVIKIKEHYSPDIMATDSLKEEYTYNEDGNITESVYFEKRDPTADWIPQYKSIFEYKSGNPSKETEYYNNNGWELLHELDIEFFLITENKEFDNLHLSQKSNVSIINNRGKIQLFVNKLLSQKEVLEIYNLSGKKIDSVFPQYNNNRTIYNWEYKNLLNLSDGIYILKVNNTSIVLKYTLLIN